MKKIIASLLVVGSLVACSSNEEANKSTASAPVASAPVEASAPVASAAK